MLPTAALDALVSQGNNALVDIRPAQEKEVDGVPDLAYSGEATLSCGVVIWGVLPHGCGG